MQTRLESISITLLAIQPEHIFLELTVTTNNSQNC